MTLNYRGLLRTEIPIAVDVFLIGVRELAQSRGLPAPSNYTRESVTPAYEHLFETGIFEVAELDGHIVGFAAAIVRDSIWFLAMFWVLPEHKLRGIGRPLLERVQKLGAEQGATILATWSSIDFAAVASYLKLGLLPGCQIFTFTGALSKPPTVHSEADRASLDLAQASGD